MLSPVRPSVCHTCESFNKKAVLSIAKMTARAMSRCGDGHSKLSKMAAAAILNLFESKIAPLEIRRPRKPHPSTKHEVDRTTGCGDIAT